MSEHEPDTGVARRRRWPRYAVVGLLLPLLAAMVLVWSTSDRQQQPRQGARSPSSTTTRSSPSRTTVAAGRSLTASLTDPTNADPKLDWKLTDTDDAKAGLRSGAVLRRAHHPVGLLQRDRVDQRRQARAWPAARWSSNGGRQHDGALHQRAGGRGGGDGARQPVDAGLPEERVRRVQPDRPVEPEGRDAAPASSPTAPQQLSQGAAQLDDGADSLADEPGPGGRRGRRAPLRHRLGEQRHRRRWPAARASSRRAPASCDSGAGEAGAQQPDARRPRRPTSPAAPGRWRKGPTVVADGASRLATGSRHPGRRPARPEPAVLRGRRVRRRSASALDRSRDRARVQADGAARAGACHGGSGTRQRPRSRRVPAPWPTATATSRAGRRRSTARAVG